MDIDKELEQELHIEFVQALHNEKIKTQSERADYTKSKFALLIGLFGLGSLRIGTLEFHWLLYLIPLVAIGYDLYIRAADLSIKKIGVFLRSHPHSGTGESEKAWEVFSAKCRGGAAPLANTLFSLIVTIAAAIYIYVKEYPKNGIYLYGFFAWLAIFLLIIVLMWYDHKKRVEKIDDYTPPSTNSK